MRQLTLNEVSFISGAESNDLVIVDPVSAIQTFLFVISVTDKRGFLYGSVMTGMTAGALGGGVYGYTALAASSGILAGLGSGALAAGAGAIVGGFACKGAALFAIGAFDLIMG